MLREESMAGGGCDLQELVDNVNKAIQTLVVARGGGRYIYVVVDKDGETMGECSDDLRPYQQAFKLEVALAEPMEITPVDGDLPDTAETFAEKARTKHTDLHPIVAALMAKLNEINGHNTPRTVALTDPKTIPPWFPHDEKVYAERAQAMSLPKLFQVLDAIFREVRFHVAAIKALHAALAAHFNLSSLNTRTRACFEAYFDFLQREAEGTGGTPRVELRMQEQGFGGPGGSPRAETPRGETPRCRKTAKGYSPRRGQKTPVSATVTDAGFRKKETGTGGRTGLRSTRSGGNEYTPEAQGLFVPAQNPHPSEIFGDGDPGRVGTPTTETNQAQYDGDQSPGEGKRLSPPKRVRSVDQIRDQIMREVFEPGASELEEEQFVKRPRGKAVAGFEHDRTGTLDNRTVTLEDRKAPRRKGKKGRGRGDADESRGCAAAAGGFATMARVDTRFDTDDMAVAAAAAALSEAMLLSQSIEYSGPAGSGGMVAENSGGGLTEGSAGMVADNSAGMASEELGGTVWDDADSEHGSFDEYLEHVNWREVIRSGMRVEVAGMQRNGPAGPERNTGLQRTVSDGYALLTFTRGAAPRDVSPAARGRARSSEPQPELESLSAVDVADWRAWERSISAAARLGMRTSSLDRGEYIPWPF